MIVGVIVHRRLDLYSAKTVSNTVGHHWLLPLVPASGYYDNIDYVISELSYPSLRIGN